jgi:cyclopropane fatty-acyl-phospholipid synthase-like methyltransferase
VAEVEAVVRLLGLRHGQAVLDVYCGYGRHALELARRGFRARGIDLALRQIEEAQRRAKAAGLGVRFVLGDVREMDFRAEFDACLNLFTSLGFFETEAENQAMLDRIGQATVPGGLFLLETWNREKMIREFAEREVEVPDGRAAWRRGGNSTRWPGASTGRTRSRSPMAARSVGAILCGPTPWPS